MSDVRCVTLKFYSIESITYWKKKKVARDDYEPFNILTF